MNTIDTIRQQIIADPMNESYTEQGIEPLFNAPISARIAIVGQAPGIRAQESQLFWNDPSGDRLRDWMGVSRDEFYESDLLAQLPMDFYFPGKGKSGDLPPRKGFAEKWHPKLLEEMADIELIILAGAYGQKYYLGKNRKKNLTETVRAYEEYLPDYFPLVHPSPLNVRWHKKNPWFEEVVIPVFRDRVQAILKG